MNSVAANNGQTALHTACERGFTPGVSYLLTCKGLEIDVKSKKGKQTPIYLAMKANDDESVRLLIVHGADLDHIVAGKSIREHLKMKMPHIDPNSMPKVRMIFKTRKYFNLDFVINILKIAYKYYIHLLLDEGPRYENSSMYGFVWMYCTYLIVFIGFYHIHIILELLYLAVKDLKIHEWCTFSKLY